MYSYCYILLYIYIYLCYYYVQPPREPDSWTEVRDALAHGSHCPGKTIVSTGINEDEDCLFLNVYTPSVRINFTLYL